jgi:hypothetical protein
VQRTIVALLVVGASRFASAQTPNAAQLLREVQAKYASMQTYSDVGEVHSSLTRSASDGSASAAADQASQIPPTSFSIKLARFQMYKVVWTQHGEKGALWSDGGYRFISMSGTKYEPQSTELAFAGAAGVSDGAANTIPSIFFNFPGNTVNSIEGATISGEESIDGDDCYVVKSHSQKSNQLLGSGEAAIDLTLWISKGSRLIRQTRADVSADISQMKISDFELKSVLEAMGNKLTDEQVQTMQTLSADALKSMGNVGAMTIQTHREIKIDVPMSPSDFRDEPQASSVPVNSDTGEGSSERPARPTGNTP